MTLEKALRLAELMEPGHVVDEELLIEFLNELEGLIQVEIMLLAPEEVIVYTSEDKGKELVLRPPHDRIYVHFLSGMIRMVQREFDDYNNQQAVVDEKLRGFKRWFLQTYRPADTHSRDYISHTPGTVGTAWRGYYLTAYGIALKHGFTGTEAEWLASLKGDKGEPALMRYDPDSGYIQWQARGDETWQDLIEVATIVEAAAAEAARNATATAEDMARLAEESKNAAAQSAEEAALMASHAEAAAKRAEDAAGGTASAEYVEAELAKLWAEIDYVPIKIGIFKRTPSVVALGTVLDTVAVSWTLNKEPALQKLNDQIMVRSARSVDLIGPFKKTTDITLVVTDERLAEDTVSAKVYFYNHVYYGLHTGRAMPTIAQLHAMPSSLQDSLGLTINAAAGDGEYVVYACPSRLGTPEFWANGFQGGFEKLWTVDHANAEGYVEKYDIWFSNAAGLNLTITVK